MKRENETYLGDGLYASHDGYQFWLRAPRDGGDHEVALEPKVMEGFFKFIAKRMNANITIDFEGVEKIRYNWRDQW